MDKSDISKLGCCATGDENWKLLQDILTELWDKTHTDTPKTTIFGKGKK